MYVMYVYMWYIFFFIYLLTHSYIFDCEPGL